MVFVFNKILLAQDSAHAEPGAIYRRRAAPAGVQAAVQAVKQRKLRVWDYIP